MRTILTGLIARLLCSFLCASGTLVPWVAPSQTATNCTAPPPGLVSWWRAQNDASDALGGNAGTVQPGVTFTAGEVGAAFSFNGATNSYIEVPDSPALRLTNELTIEFWVKRLRLDYPSLPYAEYIVEKGGDFTGGQDNYSAALHNSSYNYCLHFVFAGGWRGGGSIADTNYWHHCAIVARNGDTDPTLYIDGAMQPVLYREGASNINLYPSTRPLHIGAQLDPVTGWFYFSQTLVDELAIYNRALSAAEIQSLYAAGSLGKCVPPVPPANLAVAYSNFVAAPCLNLQGNAAIVGPALRVTPSLQGQLGTAWYCNKLPLRDGFATDFSFQITQIGCIGGLPQCGGDGFGFIVQNVDAQAFSTTAALEQGLDTNNVCVTFNTFWNWPGSYYPEPSDNFIGLLIDQQWITTTDLNPLGINMSDGLVHTGHIAFDGTTLTVGVDGVSVLTNALGDNLAAVLDANGEGWVGFGARCGAAWENHDILSWTLSTAGGGPGCVPPPFGLSSWWRAEGNGNDSIGTNNAFLSGGVAFTTNGVVGQAFEFNGVDGRVVADDSPSLNVGSNQNFSIEAWIAPLPSATDYGIMSIVDKRYAPTWTTSLGYEFNLADGRIHCRLSDSISGNGAEFGPAGPDLRDDNFHHVALSVVRSATNGGNLFVDGQVVLNFDPTAVVGDLSNAQPFRIGNHASSFVNAFFKGRIDEVSLYHRALTTSEVQAIYLAGAAGKCTAAQAPAIILQPQDQIVDGGQDAIFAVQAQGSAPLSYQWFFGTTPVDSLFGATLVVSNAQPSQAGYYHVVVSNSVGFAVSSNALLTVLTNPPTITLQPSDQTVPAGDTAMLSVSAQGTPPLSYQWFRGSVPVAGGTDTFLMLYSVQPTQAGYYSVVVSNAYGAVTSSNALLSVLTYPPAIVSQPHGTNVYVGATVTFQVIASGSPTLSYRWLKDNAPLAGANNPSYTILSAQVTNSGNYSVIITNPYGAITSSVAVLNVRVPPPCEPVPPGLVSWWRGENSVLDNWDSNNGYLYSTYAPIRYFPGKVGLCFGYSYFPVPDSPSLRPTNGLTLQAWVYATNYSGSRTILAKYDNPLATLTNGQSSYYLGATNGLVYFALSPNGAPRTNAFVLTSRPLSANEWHLVVATYDGAALRVYVDGLLANQRTYSGGIFPGNQPLAIGGLSTAQSPYSAYWPFNGLLDELAIYNRALSDSEIIALYTADVSGLCQVPPTITAPPQSQQVPLGEDVLFSASVVGSRPLNYQWYFNNQPLARATNAWLLLEKVRTNQAGPYFMRVSNSLGYASSAPATLKLLPAPTCAPAPAGLVGWWPADNSPIDVVSSNNAVLLSVYFPPYATGKVGQCFNLNNQRSTYLNRVYVPSSPVLDFGTNSDLSIEAWVKYLPGLATPGYPYPPNPPYPGFPPYLQPPSDALQLVGKYGAESLPRLPQTGYSLLLSQGHLAFWLGWSYGTVTKSALYTAGGPDLRDTMFHHVAVTLSRNKTNGGKLYVDGQDCLTFDTTGFKGGVANSAPLLIGSDGVFNGLIDELTFYSRALSAEEVLAIRQSGAAGKCKVRPFILTQPANQTVPPGSNATFSVTADGTPNLRYQWRFNGAPLVGASGSSLTIANVQSNKLGKYSVTITNGFGSVLSSNALLALNVPPVPVIYVSPLADFPGFTNLLVIAGNGTNATVVFDGSKSYDPDDATFNYAWFEGTNRFSTSVVATRVLALGLHNITLQLDDTHPFGVSTASVMVEVISASQALARLMAIVNDSTLPNQVQHPLLVSLQEAKKHLDRGDLRPAREVLQAFEHKVRESVSRLDLALAKELIGLAQQLIDALDRVGRSGRPNGPPPLVTHQPDGKMHLRFIGESGKLQIIEASSNLLDWQKIGVATEVGNGWFEFEDAKAPAMPSRYYRVVSP